MLANVSDSVPLRPGQFRARFAEKGQVAPGGNQSGSRDSAAEGRYHPPYEVGEGAPALLARNRSKQRLAEGSSSEWGAGRDDGTAFLVSERED